MSINPHQLFLLADHVKLSLLERQRAISLNLESNKQDGQITRSLESLRQGVESLGRQRFDDEAAGQDISSLAEQIIRLKTQYEDLNGQFTGSPTNPTSPTLNKPNDPALSADFAAASRTPSTSLRNNSKSPASKSVRFGDGPSAQRTSYRDDEEDEADSSNRASLFDRPYRDEPDPDAAPDQTDLSNQQIHSYHKQVLRDQDDQLDVLGQSIGRQRDLSIQMGNELDEQAVILDDVDRGVDRHQGALDRGNARIKTISRKAKENWSWLTIGILIVILVLLIILLKT